MIDVLVVEDQPIAQYFYKKEFEGSKDYNVVSYASNGFEAIEVYKDKRPDIVVMDIQMMGCNGIKASTEILALEKSAKIVVVTTSMSKYFFIKMKLLGVKCFLYREDLTKRRDILFEAIINAVNGGNYLSDSFRQMVFDLIGNKKGTPLDGLTPAEFDVLYMLSLGESPDLVANHMGSNRKAVYACKKRALDRLSIGTVDEFMELAKHDGIIFR